MTLNLPCTVYVLCVIAMVMLRMRLFMYILCVVLYSMAINKR